MQTHYWVKGQDCWLYVCAGIEGARRIQECGLPSCFTHQLLMLWPSWCCLLKDSNSCLYQTYVVIVFHFLYFSIVEFIITRTMTQDRTRIVIN